MDESRASGTAKRRNMNLRHPTFHYSRAVERLSVPSPYAGSNFASLCAAYAVLVTALTNSNACTLSWWAVILIVLGMFLAASMLSYWQSGRVLQNQFTNAIDIERRLSAEIREQGKSDPSALPDDNLAGILYRVNVLKSDLRTLGPDRSPGSEPPGMWEIHHIKLLSWRTPRAAFCPPIGVAGHGCSAFASVR